MPAKSTPEDGSASPEPCATERPARILLVDDHEETRTLMKWVLERRGYEIHAEETMAGALQVAEQTPFDLVVSDIGLPDGNGIDLMRQLRDRGDIKGIALSGFGRDVDIDASKRAGFLEHLTKPVGITRLEQAIERALARPSPTARLNHPR